MQTNIQASLKRAKKSLSLLLVPDVSSSLKYQRPGSHLPDTDSNLPLLSAAQVGQIKKKTHLDIAMKWRGDGRSGEWRTEKRSERSEEVGSTGCLRAYMYIPGPGKRLLAYVHQPGSVWNVKCVRVAPYKRQATEPSSYPSGCFCRPNESLNYSA